MKVIFVNPPAPKIELYNIGVRAPPLGLAYLASVLERKGHDVRIIDASRWSYLYPKLEVSLRENSMTL